MPYMPEIRARQFQIQGPGDSREVDKDRSSLVAVTPGKVLRHHHHDPVRLIMHIENLAVIVGEITMLYGLRDEGPQQESLVMTL